MGPRREPVRRLMVGLKPSSGFRNVAKSMTASTRRVWWTSFTLLALAGSLWALASPPYSGPDEPAHVIRAASVVRGQVLGDETERRDNNALAVLVPTNFATSVPCFAFQPQESAQCFIFPSGVGDTTVVTTAGRHSPFSYAVVGLPSLLNQSPESIYTMRLVSALLAAALIASALTTLASAISARMALIGLVVALTPMVLFVSGLVNPSSIEIAGAIGTWVGGLALIRAAQESGEAKQHGDLPTSGIPSRLVWSTSAAASALVLSRALSPLWLAGIVVVFLIITPWSAIRLLASDRLARWGAALVGAAGLLHLGWILWARPLAATDPKNAIAGTVQFRTSLAFERSIYYPRDMVANVGWLDTPAPQWLALLWFAMFFVLLAIGLMAGSARQRLGIIVVLVATLVIPLAMDVMQAPRTGLIWQGRYTIPLAVGVPLLSGWVAATSQRRPSEAALDWLAPVYAAGFVVAHVAMYLTALHRYAVGVGGSGRFLWADVDWSPPLGNPGSLAAFTVVILLLGWRMAAPRRLPAQT